jgi:hypothetical protein
VERAEKNMNRKITEDVRWFLEPLHAVSGDEVFTAGVRLAAGANFYIPEILGRQIMLEGES